MNFAMVTGSLASLLSLSLLAACGSDDANAGAPPAVGDADASTDAVSTVGDGATDVDASATDDAAPRWDSGASVPVVAKEMWAGGGMNCARVERGDASTIECWGANYNGELGRGETSMYEWAPGPLSVLDPAHIVRIANTFYGYGRTCAVLDDASVRCWGSGFDWSVDVQPHAVPISGVAELGLGTDYSCARLENGHVACWGYNASGQLGLGSADYVVHAEPAEIPDFDLEQLAVENYHACGVRAGEVWCWGQNSGGALGLPSSTAFVSTPTRVEGLPAIAKVAVGYQTTCAIGSDKTVWCWGLDPMLRTPNPTPVHVLDPVDGQPDRVLGGVEELAVATVKHVVCARLEDGSVSCWGDDPMTVGYRGLSFDDPTLKPYPVLGITHAKRIVAGGAFACAVLDDGLARCWGGNASGELGTDNAYVPGTAIPHVVAF